MRPRAGVRTGTDLGFVGLDDQPDDDPVIITGRKATRNHRLATTEKEANRLVSSERAAVEQGFANLKARGILSKVRMHAPHATALLRALPVQQPARMAELTGRVRAEGRADQDAGTALDERHQAQEGISECHPEQECVNRAPNRREVLATALYSG